MKVSKVRGENKIGTIVVSQAEYRLAIKLGVKIEDFVKQRLLQIAKKRRWKWYLERKES